MGNIPCDLIKDLLPLYTDDGKCKRKRLGWMLSLRTILLSSAV